MGWFCWTAGSCAGSEDGSRNRSWNLERCGVGYVNNNSSTINFIFILEKTDIQKGQEGKARERGGMLRE